MKECQNPIHAFFLRRPVVFYTFSEMKEHTTKERKTWGTLRHYYRWRSNESFYNDSYHRSRDLFEIQKR